MATLILGTIAKNAGWNAFWSGAAAMAGSIIDQSLFAPSFSREGPRLDDLRLQTSTYGAFIPRIYGTVRAECNVIWGTNYVEHVTTEKQGGGGKGGGGGGEVTTTSYTYSVSFAVGICQGPIQSLGRVWADGKLIDLSKHSYILYYGTETQNPDPFIEGIEGAGNVPAYRGLAYIVFKDFYVTDYGNRIPNLSFEVTHAIHDLKAIVDEISRDAGLEASEFDAASLEGITVPGYIASGEKTRRSQVEELQMLYVFDGVERNGQAVFRTRDFTKVTAVSLDEMGVSEQASSAGFYTVTRMDERELPARLTIKYLSADKDYQQGVMTAFRQITESRNEKTLDAGFVLTDSAAKFLADTRLYEAWIGRTKYEFSLGSRYAHILPGDILELALVDNRKVLVVVSKTAYGKPGIIKIQAESTYSGTYVVATRAVDPEPEVQPAPAATAVTAEFLDIPRLPGDANAADDTMYVAATAEVYYGASVFRSNDNGLTYSLSLYRIPQATMGVTSSALGSGPTAFWDNANTLDVVLASGTLESRPALDVLNGFNAALVGEEIIQFTTAVLMADKTYRLSGLLRGRLGTEHKVASHGVGDRFVLLSSATLGKLTVPSSDWFRSQQYRVGPATLPITHLLYQDKHVTPQGIMALPLSPCHIKGARDAGGNLTITWKRRTRADGSWKNYVDVPLGETTETYDVEILGDGSQRIIGYTTTPGTNVANQATITLLAGRWSNGSAATLVNGQKETNSDYAVDTTTVGSLSFAFAAAKTFSQVKIWNSQVTTDPCRGVRIYANGSLVLDDAVIVPTGGRTYDLTGQPAGTTLRLDFPYGTSSSTQRISEVEIYTAGSQTPVYESIPAGTVVRTIRANTPLAAYSAADQTADFGGVQSLIKVRIYQLSETRGRGTKREETI